MKNTIWIKTTDAGTFRIKQTNRDVYDLFVIYQLKDGWIRISDISTINRTRHEARQLATNRIRLLFDTSLQRVIQTEEPRSMSDFRQRWNLSDDVDVEIEAWRVVE